MFGDGAISSSESHVSSALGVPPPCVWEVGFRLEIGVCAGWLPVGGFGSLERVGSSGSRVDTALEVVGVPSSIMHSGGEDWCARDFPFLEAVSHSGLLRRTGVRDRFGVRESREFGGQITDPARSPGPIRHGALPSWLGRTGLLWRFPGAFESSTCFRLYDCRQIVHDRHFSHCFVHDSERGSKWSLVMHTPGSSAGRKQLLDILKQTIHQP